MDDMPDSTVYMVENGAAYHMFVEYFDIEEESFGDPRTLATTENGRNATLVSYNIPEGLDGFSDARMEFRVIDESNELHDAKVVLTDYADDGTMQETLTYTIRERERCTR